MRFKGEKKKKKRTNAAIILEKKKKSVSVPDQVRQKRRHKVRAKGGLFHLSRQFIHDTAAAFAEGTGKMQSRSGGVGAGRETDEI